MVQFILHQQAMLLILHPIAGAFKPSAFFGESLSSLDSAFFWLSYGDQTMGFLGDPWGFF